MNYDETIKLAYGMGCLATLRQYGVDPAVFCKTAAQTHNSDLLKMADAVASVYNYQTQQPAYAEKVASVVFEKTAAGPLTAAMKAMDAPAASATRAMRMGPAAGAERHFLGQLDDASAAMKQMDPTGMVAGMGPAPAGLSRGAADKMLDQAAGLGGIPAAPGGMRGVAQNVMSGARYPMGMPGRELLDPNVARQVAAGQALPWLGGAAALGGGGALGYQAMQPEEPWYSGLTDLLGG
jgi:hypothetical protein